MPQSSLVFAGLSLVLCKIVRLRKWKTKISKTVTLFDNLGVNQSSVRQIDVSEQPVVAVVVGV